MGKRQQDRKAAAATTWATLSNQQQGFFYKHYPIDRIEHATTFITFDISRSSQCSTTGVTKAVVCIILSVGWCI